MPLNFALPQIPGRDDEDEEEQQTPGALEAFRRFAELPPLPNLDPEPVEGSPTLLNKITDASSAATQELTPSTAPSRESEAPEGERIAQLRRTINSLESAQEAGSGQFFSEQYNRETEETLREARAELAELTGDREPPQLTTARDGAPAPQDKDDTFFEVAANGLSQAREMLAAGSAGLVEKFPALATIHIPSLRAARERSVADGDLGHMREFFRDAVAPVGEDNPQREIIQDYAQNLRREHGENLAQLAQQADPEGFIEYATYLSTQSLGFTGLAALGGAVGGMPGGMAAVYPVLRSMMQNDLESEGLSEDEADMWASATAVPLAAAESAFEVGAVGRLVSRARGTRAVAPGLRRGFAKRVAQFAREVGVGNIVEGATESVQTAIEDVVTAFATGEEIDWNQLRSNVWEAFKGGATVGTVYGGGFGFVGEAAQTRQERIATAQAERLRGYARNFDPQDVDPGTEVAGKVSAEGPGGRVVWRDPETNQFTSPPTREEIEISLLGEETAARMEARAEETTEDVEALEVPVNNAAERLSTLSEVDRDPAIVALNIREVASGYIRQAKRDVRNRSPQEIKRDIAKLEALALDPASDTDFATRVTAMARREALINESRRSDSKAVTSLDTTVGARAWAGLDGNTFALLAGDIEQRGDELELRMLREARALRETEEQRVRSQSRQVRRYMQEASVDRARGLAPDSRVVREDGMSGTVVNVRRSGFPEVVWDGADAAVTVNPDDVHIMPQPGQLVETTGGEVLEVQQVTDSRTIRATLPNGNDTVVRPNEIERIGGRESAQQDLTARREAQQLQGEQVTDEQRAPVVTPTEAVHAFTGQRVQVAAVGSETIELTDGTTVSREDISFSSDLSTPEAIRQTGEIPVYEPGTQPSAEGRHINFLQVPESYVPIIEAAARSSDPNQIGQLLHDLSGTGASLHLLPQPSRPGTQLYAVEMSGEARDLTDASKRLLGAINGNVSMDKINPSTLMSRVRINRPLAGDEMRLMRVPEGLRAAVQNPSAIKKMSDSEARDYLRRLADLNFNMDAAVSAALIESGESQQAARDAQVDADANPGEAEVAEISAKTSRARAVEAALKSEVGTKLEVWDAIVEELNADLTPRERTLVDALNGSTAEDLEVLPGVGPRLAERIAQEAGEGNIEHVQDLLDVDRLGPQTYERIIQAFESGAWNPTAPISDAREQRLKELLKDLPGRSGQDASNWVLAYEHPQIPGLVLTIDKERIPTPIEVGGRAFQGERDIYHITFVTPDGTQVRARTVGTDERKIKVPKHLALARGGRATPPAIEAINEGLENGVEFDDIVEQLRSRRRTVTEILIGEEVFEVVDQAQGTVTVEGEDGSVFQLSQEQVAQDGQTREEELREIVVPIRMTPDNVVSEVLRETRKFKTQAKIIATGEWRAQAPGVYAEVRPSGEGFQVAVLQEPYEATLKKPRLYEVRSVKNFDSRSEAEGWLRNNGYGRAESIMQKAETFQSLPPVDEIPQSLPEPAEGETLDDQQWDMGRVDREMTDILEFYASKGFVPQPVRDYAVRFALRYNQVVQEPVFTEKARRAVNIFTARDARRAAQRGKNDFAAIPQRAGRDFVLEHGNVVVNRKTLGERGDNTRVLDGILVDPYIEGSHPAKMRAARDIYERHEQNQRFMDMGDVDGDLSISTLQERLVEVGPERRLGVILDAQLGKETVKVQVFQDGEASISTVKKGDVIRIRDPRKLLDYQRAARDSMGEMTNLPKTPEMGASPKDKKFGLDGVQSRAHYIKGLRERVGEMLKHVDLDENGNLTVTDQDILFNLADAWIRMKELGIPNQVRHPELEDIQSNFETKYGEVVMRGQLGDEIADDTPLIPPGLITSPRRDAMGPILDLAYDRVAGQFSNVSPYGDVMAKAKLGLLTRRQEKRLNKQADIFGIDPDLPLYRKVEELMQNVWDPNTAHMLYSMRREVGAVGFLGEALKSGKLKHGLEIRMPAMGSTIHMNWFTKNIMTPREAGYRHPTARVFHYLAEKYRTRHGNDVKRYADLIKGVQAMEQMTPERKETIWSLLQDEELGDWMSVPGRGPAYVPTRSEVLENASDETLEGVSDGWNWYQQYEVLRNLAVELRSENIRNALVRGFKAKEINFEDATPKGIGERIGVLKIDGVLSKGEADRVQNLALQGERVYNLERVSNAGYARPRDEVETFIKLIETYPNLESIPNNVHSDMTEWMIDEFDFWARYGINNYAPKIVQGQHAIKQKNPNGEDILRAFAPDGQTAHEFLFRVQRGQIDGVPRDAELYLEYRKARADDIDMAFLGPKRFATFFAKMAQKHGGEQGAEFAGTAARELRLGSEPASPRDLHTQARISDLSDVIEDPYERMLIYAARTSRNNFLLDIEHGYETARSMDPAISRAHGIEAVYPSDRFRETGHEVMQSYLAELRDSYMGKAGSWEKAFNVLIGIVDTVGSMPNRLKNKLLGKMNIRDYNLWNDPAFIETLYNNDYSARRWAESLTSTQSILRLGLNFGGSAINATQHFAFGPSYYMTRGASAFEAQKFMAQGYKDMLGLWRVQSGDTMARGPENAEELARFAEDVGVGTVPARGVAGPGLGITGQGKPINFEGKARITHAMDLVNYYGMMPFSKAEESVRLSTAFSARRMALDRGMSRDAAIQFARDAIDNTQFQYYDQALPPFMRGSVARVLFQFQQFPLNAIKYEKDLMMATFGKGRGQFKNMSKADAAKAWFMFNATGLTLGGASWLASRPLIASALGWITWQLTKTFGDDEPEDMQAFIANSELFGQGGAEWREAKYSGNVIGDPELFRARDFVLYGVPGLLGLNLSTRLGVSGLDIDPTRLTDLMFGPTSALHADTWNALTGEEGFHNIRPDTWMGASAGALAGLVASQALPGKGSGAATAATLGALTSVAAISEILSQANDAPGTDLQYWINNEDAGRAYMRSVLPNVIEGAGFAYDVFTENHIYDANLQQRQYVGDLNKVFESAARIAGFQTIRSSEQRALLQARFQRQQRDRQRRSQFATMMARAARDNNRDAVNALAAQARETGVEINDSDIERMYEWLDATPEDKIADQSTNWMRYGF